MFRDRCVQLDLDLYKDDYELAEEHAMTHPAHRATAHPRHAEQRSSAATLSAPVRESLSR
jgi:hypothetical protein